MLVAVILAAPVIVNQDPQCAGVEVRCLGGSRPHLDFEVWSSWCCLVCYVLLFLLCVVVFCFWFCCFDLLYVDLFCFMQLFVRRLGGVGSQ